MVRGLPLYIIFIACLILSLIPSMVLAQDSAAQAPPPESGAVEGFLNDRISLGGFLDAAMSGIWGSGTSAQFAATPENFALNLAADLNDRFRLNSQVQFQLVYPLENQDNDPNASSIGLPSSRRFETLTTTTSIPQIYVEYGTSPEFALQIGRGYVPFGIAFQIRDLALFRRRGGPQMINVNNDGTIVIASGAWTGVHIDGSFHVGEGRWGYDAYSMTPSSNPSALGVGSRVWYQIAQNTQVGVSDQIAKRGAGTYKVIGADLQFKSGRIGMDGEYAVNFTGNGVGVAQTYYAEPYYTFFDEKFLIYAAADYLANPFGNTLSGAVELSDPYQKWQFGGGVNWLPYTYTRFRVGLLYNDYTGSTANVAGANRNYLALDLSAGIEF